MRTDAQQGIILNIVVGIVGAVIAGLLLGGGNINQAITDRDVPLFAARRGHPAGDRQPDSPGHRPLNRDASRTSRRPRGISRAAFSCAYCSSNIIAERDLELLLAGIDLASRRRLRARFASSPASAAAPDSSAAFADRQQPHDAHARARGHKARRAPARRRSPWRALRRAPPRACRWSAIGPLIWLAPSATSASRISPVLAMSRKRTLTWFEAV